MAALTVDTLAVMDTLTVDSILPTAPLMVSPQLRKASAKLLTPASPIFLMLSAKPESPAVLTPLTPSASSSRSHTWATTPDICRISMPAIRS